ncbi:MAG: serine--tRNA ligase, partial [Planctomycetota bacterium]
MLDRKLILENPELVKRNCQLRGVDVDVDRLVELETLRRQKQREAEEWNRQANATSKQIGKAASAEEREQLKEQGRRLRQQKEVAQAEVEALEEEILELLLQIPNLTHPDAPVGSDDSANLEIARGKTPLPEFDFPPRDHL